MTNTSYPLDSVLRSVAETRGKLDYIEQYWKRLRNESRGLALQLMLDHGYSVTKTARVTGHHRNTLKVWLAVAGAEDGETER